MHWHLNTTHWRVLVYIYTFGPQKSMKNEGLYGLNICLKNPPKMKFLGFMVCVYMYVYIYNIYIYVYVYIIYIYIYIYVYVYMYIYILCIYIHTYDHVYKYIYKFLGGKPPHPRELEVDSTWVSVGMTCWEIAWSYEFGCGTRRRKNAERRFFYCPRFVGWLSCKKTHHIIIIMFFVWSVWENYVEYVGSWRFWKC